MVFLHLEMVQVCSVCACVCEGKRERKKERGDGERDYCLYVCNNTLEKGFLNGVLRIDQIWTCSAVKW